jgi:signal transduction histidine kinase
MTSPAQLAAAAPPMRVDALHFPLARQLAGGLGVVLFVLLGVAAASWYTVHRFISRADDALREAAIVVPLKEGVAQLYEAGAAQRGYFFTGSQDYLAQRAEAVTGWNRAIAELRAAAEAEPSLRPRIDALEALGAARMRRLDEVLTTHERSPEEARDLLASGYGSAEMHDVNEVANALAAERQRLLRDNARAARVEARRVFWAFGLALAAVAALLIGQLRTILRGAAERRRAELRQAELMQELRAANEELGNFAYVASHDLKAPLRGIGSLAQWIVADYGDRLDDAGREQMALLLGRVHRMDRLIDGVLQVSRVGRTEEPPEPVDLGALVHETVDLLAPPPHVTVDVGPLPTLRMDRTRAQQLFQNLLSNAIRCNDKPQGRIVVSCNEAGGERRYSVADNGPGIEPRHYERVFQMFQTLDARDEDRGTGVGLALVRKIVELHGGRIWIESEPGRGCTFHFTLPKASPCIPAATRSS